MSHVFGISNHSPDQVLSFLVRRKIIGDMSDVAIVPSGTRLRPGSKPVRDALFVIATADLYANIAILNSRDYVGTKIFVFASALKLRALSGVTPLDYEDNPEVSSVSFRYTAELNYANVARALRQICSPIHKAPVDYLHLLASGVKTGSLLNPLMTFVYSVPSHSQTTVKEYIAKYISGDLPTGLKKFLTRLDAKLSVPLTPKHITRLQVILSSEQCLTFMSAFKKMLGKWEVKDGNALDLLCKTLSISAYEMRYLRSVSQNTNADKKSIREVVSNGQ